MRDYITYTLLIALVLCLSMCFGQEVINDKNFVDKVGAEIVVVEFFADWNANNCLDLSAFKDIKSFKVDIEDSPHLLDKYSIKSVPTVIILQNNKLIEKYEADITLQLCTVAIKKKIDALILTIYDID